LKTTDEYSEYTFSMSTLPSGKCPSYKNILLYLRSTICNSPFRWHFALFLYHYEPGGEDKCAWLCTRSQDNGGYLNWRIHYSRLIPGFSLRSTARKRRPSGNFVGASYVAGDATTFAPAIARRYTHGDWISRFSRFLKETDGLVHGYILCLVFNM
jgi:hypothetical protein